MGELLSPMPGTIIKILVKNGDLVKEDSQAMVLEAMKMETPIVSGFEGTKMVQIMAEEEGEAVAIKQALLRID